MKSVRRNFHSVQISSLAILLVICLISSNGAPRSSSLIAYYLNLWTAINSFRTTHTVPALRWNRTMTDGAENYAQQIAYLASNNTLDPEAWAGCNFYIFPENVRPPVATVASAWYDESFGYDFSNPVYSSSYSNYTQMIWKTTTDVGIGVYNGNSMTVVVAKFFPIGNVRGKFKQNVLPIYVKM